MAERTQLDLRGWDVPVLAGALVAGFVMAWAAEPLLAFILFWCDGASHPQIFDPLRGSGFGDLHVALHLTGLVLLPLTLAVALVPLLRWGKSRHAVSRLPGVVACQGIGVVVLLEVMLYPLYQQLLLYGELTRLQGSAFNNIMQLPRFPLAAPGSGRWVFAALVANLGGHAGLAGLGVLIAWWVVGLPPAPPSAWNRLGLALAITWVGISLGLALVPLT